MTVRLEVVLLALALVLTGCGRDDPQKLLASAKEFIAKRDYKAAVIQLKNALQKDSEMPEVRFLLGKALLEQGDAAGAALELGKALELKHARDEVMPLLLRSYLLSAQNDKVIEEGAKAGLISSNARSEVLVLMAAAHFAKNDRAAADKAIAEALKLNPSSELAQLAGARVAAASGDVAGAMNMVEKVIAANPRNFDAARLKGDLQSNQGQLEAATTSYRKAFEIQPDSVLAQAAIVSTLLARAKFDPNSPLFAEAVKEFATLKRVSPNSLQVLYLDAQLAFHKRDFKAGREAAQRLIRVLPNASNALQLSGAIEYNLGSFTVAESQLVKALRLDPNSIGAARWLAKTHLSAGQPAKAMAVIEPVVARVGGDADILYLAGEIYAQNGAFRKAEDAFTRATRIQPDDASKRTALSLVRLAMGQQGALNELENISNTDKGTVADLALISAYVNRGQAKQAFKALDALDKKQPNLPATYNLRGQIQLAQKDRVAARKSFERALEIKPSYYSAAANLADLDIADKDLAAAAQRFERVVAADPNSAEALLSLARLRRDAGAPSDEVVALITKAIGANPSDFSARIVLSTYYLERRDNSKALAAAQEAMAAFPTSPEVFEVLGQTQRKMGDLNQAMVTYSKLAALRPNLPEPHLRIAELHSINRNYDGAVQSLRKALEINPDLPIAQRSLANVETAQGKTQEALAVARDMQKRRPKDPIGYLVEGDLSASAKAWDAAAAAYRVGLKQSAATELAFKLHAVLLEAKKPADAEKVANEWLAEHPKDMTFRNYLSESALHRRDLPTAARHLRAILEAQPNSPAAMNNLAIVLDTMKQPGALELAEKANKLAPNQPAFMDTLALMLADRGDNAKALELLEGALKIAPQNTNVRFNYARVLMQAGRQADAKRELQELAKLGDKLPAKAQVESMLKGL